MTSDIRVGRGSKIAPKIRRYRVGQGRYSSVPNRRAVRNKRAGGKILKKH